MFRSSRSVCTSHRFNCRAYLYHYPCQDRCVNYGMSSRLSPLQDGWSRLCPEIRIQYVVKPLSAVRHGASISATSHIVMTIDTNTAISWKTMHICSGLSRCMGVDMDIFKPPHTATWHTHGHRLSPTQLLRAPILCTYRRRWNSW